jgi:5-methylcytosine-specific restriction endonuclease McrA
MQFSQKTIEKVWEKGTVVETYNPDAIRKDAFGAWILRDHYGNNESEYSWEIDHIVPLSEGGAGEISNLQPLQWENKNLKDDGFLTGRITSFNASNLRIR